VEPEKKEIVANANGPKGEQKGGKPKKILDRAKITCFNCGVRSHLASECPNKEKKDEEKNFFVLGYHGMATDKDENQNCDGFGFEGFFDDFGPEPLFESGLENSINLNKDICDDLFEGVSMNESFLMGEPNWPSTEINDITEKVDKFEITFDDLSEPTSNGLFSTPFLDSPNDSSHLFAGVVTKNLEAELIVEMLSIMGAESQVQSWAEKNVLIASLVTR
jgi:Zinc knuckle